MHTPAMEAQVTNKQALWTLSELGAPLNDSPPVTPSLRWAGQARPKAQSLAHSCMFQVALETPQTPLGAVLCETAPGGKLAAPEPRPPMKTLLVMPAPPRWGPWLARGTPHSRWGSAFSFAFCCSLCQNAARHAGALWRRQGGTRHPVLGSMAVTVHFLATGAARVCGCAASSAPVGFCRAQPSRGASVRSCCTSGRRRCDDTSTPITRHGDL